MPWRRGWDEEVPGRLIILRPTWTSMGRSITAGPMSLIPYTLEGVISLI